MKKNKILARILSCMLTMSFMTVMSSCGEKEDNSKQIRIIGKTPLQNSFYWEVVNAGASAAGEELGYDVEYFAPENEKDTEGQIAIINKAKEDKIDGIVIAPINADDMNDAMQEAKKAGVSVLTIDSKCSLDDMVYIGTDNYVAGTIAGAEASKMLTESKKVAIVALTEESTLAVRWKGFEDAVASDSTISIVEKTY
ncbi:MAG: substrate-binding domain-containing protein, partial [Ruminococcus sp.]